MGMKSADETSADRDAREAREKIVADREHDAKVAAKREDETDEQRKKREGDEAARQYTLQQLGRIEEIRNELGRADENYKSSTSQVFQRLQALVGTSNPEVAKAAKVLADEYDIRINPRGFKQPELPKGAKSPFEDGGKK